MKKILTFAMLLFSVFYVFAESEDDKPLLAVMEIEDATGNFDQKSLSGATEYLRGLIIGSGDFIIVAKNRQEKEMIEMLRKESYSGCYDDKCHLALGKALSADTILTTRIDSVGSTYVITSVLIDIERAATVKRAQQTFVGKNNALLPILRNLVDQITGKKSSMKLKQDLYLSESNFYGTYSDNYNAGGIIWGTFIPGASLVIAGFATLAVGLWQDFKVKDKYDCGDELYCWEYDYVSHNQNDYSYIDSHTSRKQAQAKADKSRKAHIISGAVLLGAGIPFFITGITYAVWDEYTIGERAAGYMISFGVLAAAGGGAMIGLNDGNNTMFYGGISAAAVGGGLLIGGITMAVLDARARELKGGSPRTSFFVVPNKGGAYAQLGVNF